MGMTRARGITVERRTPGTWFGVSDEALDPSVVQPVQFHDIWSRSATVPPERQLALAVVQEALHDLARFRFAHRRRGQRLYWQAYTWVADDDRQWPFSFVNLCEVLGLDVEAIRRHFFDQAKPLRQSVATTDAAHGAPFGQAA
jgi:hypothetical protein